MLGIPPWVPHTIDDFQQYLKSGAVALTPSFHSCLVADHPCLQAFTFAAGSEGSFLAQSMGALVRGYNPPAGIHTAYLSPTKLMDQQIAYWHLRLSPRPGQGLQKPLHMQFCKKALNTEL